MHEIPVFAAEWAGEVLNELHRLRAVRSSGGRPGAPEPWEEPLVAHFQQIVDREAGKAPGRGGGADLTPSLPPASRLSPPCDRSGLRPSSARMLLGQALCLAGQMHAAVEEFQECREHPDLALSAWNWLGICAASMQGFHSEQMAVANLRRGLELEGYPRVDYLPLHVNLGLMLERLGEFGSAAEHYQAVAEISPAYHEAQTREKEARRAQKLSDRRGDQVMRGPLPVPHPLFLERGRNPAALRRRGW